MSIYWNIEWKLREYQSIVVPYWLKTSQGFSSPQHQHQIILIRQMLPAPNTFQPTPNIISKFRKYSFLFWKWKSGIENNTFRKNKFRRDFCVSDIKIRKKKIKIPFRIKFIWKRLLCSEKRDPECNFICISFFKGIFSFSLWLGAVIWCRKQLPYLYFNPHQPKKLLWTFMCLFLKFSLTF